MPAQLLLDPALQWLASFDPPSEHERRVVAIWQEFKRLHPMSREPFQPNEYNVERWRRQSVWKRQQDQIRQSMLARRPNDHAAWALALLARRRVQRFEAFPVSTRRRYLELSAYHYPGEQLYACGSRVAGHWIDPSSPKRIARARAALGFKSRTQSDYDFQVRPLGLPLTPLPAWADLARVRIPSTQLIPVPMAWNFQKLPAAEYERAQEALATGDELTLVKLHDQYGLSDYTYCCDLTPVRVWFRYALRAGYLGVPATMDPETPVPPDA